MEAERESDPSFQSHLTIVGQVTGKGAPVDVAYENPSDPRHSKIRLTHDQGDQSEVRAEDEKVELNLLEPVMCEQTPVGVAIGLARTSIDGLAWYVKTTLIEEGQSAGCTITTSLLSLAMKKPVRKDLAMTGMITETGRILLVTGVKEKTIGARRSQVKTIIFPEANRREFDELEENMKEGLDVHFVEEYEQIFKLAFGYDHH
ncbi:unnamed protein product [Arabis nemorensis]|uniref:Lon proteolytic domain-containing protein n=1 Tax=Arabis nemorensis TaxID=586526 RepID=A0A565AYR3_9BRAS|nr:unnamed protein product [Arabis nemorensis]